ncbi:MAG: hypothetical protein AAB217_21925 [Chloroflexota bacterium]
MASIESNWNYALTRTQVVEQTAKQLQEENMFTLVIVIWIALSAFIVLTVSRGSSSFSQMEEARATVETK